MANEAGPLVLEFTDSYQEARRAGAERGGQVADHGKDRESWHVNGTAHRSQIAVLEAGARSDGLVRTELTYDRVVSSDYVRFGISSRLTDRGHEVLAANWALWVRTLKVSAAVIMSTLMIMVPWTLIASGTVHEKSI